MKAFIMRYRHAWILFAYAAIYMPWFAYIEHRSCPMYHIIHMAADDYIPFCEYFIIPYFFWFIFVPLTIVLMLFTSRVDFYRICTFLFTGMTIFLIISTVYPNGDLMRPDVFPRDNIFTSMVLGLYNADTPTNLFPSIHVYNSLGAVFAIVNSEKLRRKKGICISSAIVCALIIMSTVFLKQHSVFDVITAFIMAAIMYVFVYGIDYNAIAMAVKKRQREQVMG